jgi:hypothetical protein
LTELNDVVSQKSGQRTIMTKNCVQEGFGRQAREQISSAAPVTVFVRFDDGDDIFSLSPASEDHTHAPAVTLPSTGQWPMEKRHQENPYKKPATSSASTTDT